MTPRPDTIATPRQPGFFINQDAACVVGHCLVATGAYKVNLRAPEKDWFTWRSGLRAPCYCNCRDLFGHPDETRIVADALADGVRIDFPEADAVIGMATAGVPWATLVAAKLRLPLGYVRSVSKQHGLGFLVEGVPSGVRAAVLIDDLVASGESLMLAADRLRSEKSGAVVGIYSIVNWGFQRMRQKLAHLPVYTLTSYPQILSAAEDAKCISEEERVQLCAFYADPADYKWPNSS